MDSDDLIGKLKVSLESLTDHNSMVFEESLRPQGSLHFWITWIPEAGKASGGSGGGGGSPGAKAAPQNTPKGGAKAKPKGNAKEEPAASAREPATLDDGSPDPKPKKASKKAKA